MNQTVKYADNSLVDQWKLMKNYGCNSKLFIVKSFFDEYDKTGPRTLDQIKSDLKTSFYKELELDDLVPFYCVSFKQEHKNEEWNSDLRKLLGNRIETSDWFANGLKLNSKSKLTILI